MKISKLNHDRYHQFPFHSTSNLAFTSLYLSKFLLSPADLSETSFSTHWVLPSFTRSPSPGLSSFSFLLKLKLVTYSIYFNHFILHLLFIVPLNAFLRLFLIISFLILSPPVTFFFPLTILTLAAAIYLNEFSFTNLLRIVGWIGNISYICTYLILTNISII